MRVGDVRCRTIIEELDARHAGSNDQMIVPATSQRRIRARENFGHRYFQRIRAYLAWAIYAQGLVREAETRLLDEASRRKAANAH